MPERTNEDRAETGRRAAALAADASDNDDATNLSDILTDLHHHADAAGIDFDAAAQLAMLHHAYETANDH